MSLNQVDKLQFALFNDLELQESYKQNPAEVLKRYDLQDSELEALHDLNAGALSDPGLSFFGEVEVHRTNDWKGLGLNQLN
jgi:hypothetical protein